MKFKANLKNFFGFFEKVLRKLWEKFVEFWEKFKKILMKPWEKLGNL